MVISPFCSSLARLGNNLYYSNKNGLAVILGVFVNGIELFFSDSYKNKFQNEI